MKKMQYLEHVLPTTSAFTGCHSPGGCRCWSAFRSGCADGWRGGEGARLLCLGGILAEFLAHFNRGHERTPIFFGGFKVDCKCMVNLSGFRLELVI